jgi:predicted house-cleaning NTP pyrophosphatase (Maf/HAM1 superfamily)
MWTVTHPLTALAATALFDAIRTTDSTAIIGLPLLRLSAVLRNLGVAIP